MVNQFIVPSFVLSMMLVNVEGIAVISESRRICRYVGLSTNRCSRGTIKSNE